ncbi:MAG TPA: PASTA domain-containing protein [Thermoanaerobaculia bacterium]|jgi:hypothetical protein|nr:PASTA domain-containing protein [Thermoanaerobaculia bacterium]
MLRLLLLLLSAATVAAQQPAPPVKKMIFKPALTHVVQVPPAATVPPEPLKMPNVLWLNLKTAQVTLREQVRRVAEGTGEGIVIKQDPPPGADVGPNTPVTIVLGVPRLLLTASTESPRVGQKVAFRLSFDPPLRPGVGPIEYRISWDAGASEEVLAGPAVRHAFADANPHVVTATAVIEQQLTTDPATMTISVVALPSPVPPTPVQPEPVRPTPKPSPVLPLPKFVLIGIALVVLAILGGLAARKPPSQAATPQPNLSFHSEISRTDYTIERPESVCTGPHVRLRSGIRSMVVMEGDTNV